MATTRQLRSWWRLYRCLKSGLSKPIELFGRNAGRSAIPAYDGFKAFEVALIANGYRNVKSVWVPRNCPTGIGGKTCQKDGTNCSLHNYGIAVDVDPFKYGNPHFRKKFGNGWDFSKCKLTRAQVEAVEAIRNMDGEQMFRWLGWAIGDTMHFEFQVPPSRAKVDWTTVPGESVKEEEMSLRNGDQGNAVGYYQEALIGWDENALPEFAADKDFGDETETWVRNYQKSADLDQTGIIDGVTADLLGRYHPDRAGGAVELETTMVEVVQGVKVK